MLNNTTGNLGHIGKSVIQFYILSAVRNEWRLSQKKTEAIRIY